MADVARTITLRNGVEMPRVGLGTFRAVGGDVERAVKCALAHGITHIDTATIYKNESEIGAALRCADVSRESVFITSKVSPYEHGTEKATAACNGAMQRLQTDVIDLMLIHWPAVARVRADSEKHGIARTQTWRVLETFYKEGKFRAIGVSNFKQSHLQQLMEAADIMPTVNQIEVHPRYQQRQLRRFCTDNGIVVVAYASLGCGALLNDPIVAAIARDTRKTPAQVLLRWALQSGCAVIPKSVQPQRIASFAQHELLTWWLDESHMAALDGMDDGTKFCWDPSAVV